MHHRERKKMSYLLVYAIIHFLNPAISKTIETTEFSPTAIEDNFDNNIINFEEDFSVKFNKKYGAVPWYSTDKFNKDALRYTIVKNHEEKKEKIKRIKEENKTNNETQVRSQDKASQIVTEKTAVTDYGVIPLELLSTTENILVHILDSTTEPDLLVIPLSTPKKVYQIEIKPTVTLPISTESTDITTEYTTTAEDDDKLTAHSKDYETTTKAKREGNTEKVVESPEFTQNLTESNHTENLKITTERLIENFTIADNLESENPTTIATLDSSTIKVTIEMDYKNFSSNVTIPESNATKLIKYNKLNKTEKVTENVEKSIINKTNQETLKTNSSEQIKKVHSDDFDSSEFLEDVHVFTELDTEEEDVPEDYYDAKDVVPTTAPKTDALSVIFGLAGSVVESVVESVAERVVPKGLYDLFKRMQRQNEALEAERLRSREENGGIGQFTRGILKSLSSGLSKPLSQLMAGVKDIGSLDTDRGFVSSLASGVTSVATSVVSAADAFKDKVQAIYPGTVWCGDGHSAAARSSDLGLFFFTDTCCRQHDACKIFIKAGDTKYGLTNTGLFTRSHCSCDAKFRECLRRTNSLVSAQIGLTYFNVLGPQCFRKAHPIVKCVRKTRITGQKCEEYELDYTKPKMWQWFDNETF